MIEAIPFTVFIVDECGQSINTSCDGVYSINRLPVKGESIYVGKNVFIVQDVVKVEMVRCPIYEIKVKYAN